MESYNSLWPAQFLQICAALIEQFPCLKTFTIEHIGSTAVPGLPVQPVIDVLVVTIPEHINKVASKLASNGLYIHQDDTMHPGCSLFTASDTATPHTIYLCPAQSLPARANIAIRDKLHSDSELRTYYTNPKNRITEGITEGTDDILLQAYRDVQVPILQHILISSQQFTDQELATIFQSDLSSRWEPITTPRLLLREYEINDTEGMYALESNPDNARYQSWDPWTHLEARTNVLRGILRSYDDMRLTIELAVVYEGAFVGRVGAGVQRPDDPSSVSDGDRTVVSELVGLKRHVDLWYSFLPSSQGKGLATEAMRAFIDELVRKIKQEGDCLELEIECDPRNTGSWKLAGRLDFEKISLTESAWECKGEWVDSLVYRKIA